MFLGSQHSWQTTRKPNAISAKPVANTETCPNRPNAKLAGAFAAQRASTRPRFVLGASSCISAQAHGSLLAAPSWMVKGHGAPAGLGVRRVGAARNQSVILEDPAGATCGGRQETLPDRVSDKDAAGRRYPSYCRRASVSSLGSIAGAPIALRIWRIDLRRASRNVRLAFSVRCQRSATCTACGRAVAQLRTPMASAMEGLAPCGLRPTCDRCSSSSALAIPGAIGFQGLGCDGQANMAASHNLERQPFYTSKTPSTYAPTSSARLVTVIVR